MINLTMLKKVFFLLLLLFAESLYAQSLTEMWVRKFQAQGMVSDRIADITADSSGNVYIAGYAGKHHGAPDAFAMKRSPAGDTLWTYYYDAGFNNEDFASSIVLDATGNIYLTGRSQNASYLFECFTIKLLPSGLEAWVRRYSPGANTQSYGNALTVDLPGNVYVAGYTAPASASTDWLVLKYSSAGILEWADVLNGPGNGGDEALDIVITPNGNLTVCGYTYSVNASGATNAFVKQYTPMNTTVWTATWTNPAFTGTDMAIGLGYDNLGNLYIGGETRNSLSFNRDAFAVAYNAGGTELWSHIYTDANTVSDEYILDVQVSSNGNIFLTGTDYRDGFTTCIQSNGTNGWRKLWKGPVNNGNDVFHAVTTDSNGNCYVTGRGVYPGEDYYGNGGRPNTIITKYNANGDSLWTYRCKDSLNCSMSFALSYRDGKLFSGGFTTDTAYVNENLYTIIVDTSGNPVREWIYNGIGDAITMGQVVRTDQFHNVYCAATVDRLYTNGYDIAVFKYDPSGTLLWEKYYSSPGWNNDTLNAMEFDPSGNLILCIASDSALLQNNYKITLLKMDRDGNFLDSKRLTHTDNSFVKSFQIHSNGNMALAISSNINGGLLLFCDAALNLLWQAKLDSTQFAVTRANSVCFFPNGNIAVGGYTQVNSVTSGIINNYSPAGNLLWNSIIDSANVYDEVRDIHISSTGLMAYTAASGIFNSHTTRTGLLNGTNGIEIWNRIYNPNTNNEQGIKVRITPSGKIAALIRGWTGFVARYFTVQYDSIGNLLWAKVYAQTASDREPLKLLTDSASNIVTAGWAINGTTVNYDYVLQAYDPFGATLFTNTYSSPSATSMSWDQLRDLHRDDNGDFLITGQTAHEFYNNFLFKALTIKYSGSLTNITENNQDFSGTELFVFPNPSHSGLFELYNSNPYPVKESILVDIHGKIIKRINPSDLEINISNYPNGIYLLRIVDNDATIKNLKLIKN